VLATLQCCLLSETSIKTTRCTVSCLTYMYIVLKPSFFVLSLDSREISGVLASVIPKLHMAGRFDRKWTSN